MRSRAKLEGCQLGHQSYGALAVLLLRRRRLT